MSTYTKVNGAWREVSNIYNKVDGAWREVENQYVQVDGVKREISNRPLSEKDILGFRMIYKRVSKPKHPLFPHLKFNSNLPVSVTLTGDSKEMDFNSKGILLQYTREKPEEEGLLLYEGSLYAIITNGTIGNVGMTESMIFDDSFLSNLPNLGKVYNTHKLNKLIIEFQGYETYETNGYYMNGWNHLFHTKDFLNTNYDRTYHQDLHRYVKDPLTPIDQRGSDYTPFAQIGIARDVYSDKNLMLGAEGNLDQTIEAIWVNHVKKPFLIELYD